MHRNIELKARCANLEAAHEAAQSIGAALQATERQHDVYFAAPHRRLKLRRRWIDEAALPSELIGYARVDVAHPRASDYAIVITDQGDELCALLCNALGTTTEVVKQRTVYLHDNVRIHLDKVDGLGCFIEFEAIVDATCNDVAARAKLERLVAAFGITPAQIERGSYADLLRE